MRLPRLHVDQGSRSVIPVLGELLPIRVKSLWCKPGLLGLYLFALCGWLSPFGMRTGFVLMLVGLATEWQSAWPRLKTHPTVWWACALGLFLAVRTVWGLLEFPGQAQLNGVLGWFWLCLWPLVAWWMGGNVTRTTRILALAGISLILRMLFDLDWGKAEIELFQNRNYGFGITPIGFGLYAGTVLLGSLAAALRLNSMTMNRWYRAFLAVALLIMVSLCGQGLISSGSKGAMIAFAAGLMVLIGFVAFARLKERRLTKTGLWIIAIFLMLLFGLVHFNSEKLAKRFAQDHNLIMNLLSGRRGVGDLPVDAQSPLNLRLNLDIYGLGLWRGRPLFGWGPGMGKALLDRNRQLSFLAHFHNSYVQSLVELGLIGVGLLAIGLALALGELQRSYRGGLIGPELAGLLYGSWTALLVWSLSDTRMAHVDERFLIYLLAGAATSWSLHAVRSGQAPTDSGMTD